MSEHFSLSDCDVIGFDLDHTLCRYHLKETSRVSSDENLSLAFCFSLVKNPKIQDEVVLLASLETVVYFDPLLC